MNAETQYIVNRSNSEHPSWEPAHWVGTSVISGFHCMRIDSDGVGVVKHESSIKPVPTVAKPLEDEMRRLLEQAGLVPEAHKLITAALQAQATGKTDFAI